jgi:hypothetical protein
MSTFGQRLVRAAVMAPSVMAGLALALMALPSFSGPRPAGAATAPLRPDVNECLGALAVPFVANAGQVDPRVAYCHGIGAEEDR